MDKVLIGKITSPVGLKGEVRVYNYSDRTQVYEESEYLIIGDETRRLERMRPYRNMVVLKFQGIDSREEAEAVRNMEVFVDRDELPDLDEGEVYIRDLIGMDVAEDTCDGERAIGSIIDVISNTSQDILKVRTSEGRDVMIPCVSPLIKEIDEEDKKIIVELPEGLLDL